MGATGSFDLAIVIVNYNGRDMLADCLKTIRETADGLLVQVIIVDNASTDDSENAARKELPNIVWLQQPVNRGYVPANNIGLRVAAAPYTMFLNNDTLIYPAALAHLVDWLNAHETAGAVSGQILNADGTDQGTARRFPSVANAIFGRRSLVTRLWPNNPLSRGYMVGRHRLGNEPFEVDILSSACMVVRTEPALAMGGMDEDFQLYWVDAEMCSRFQKRGYRIWCVPDAKIMHYEGQGGSTRTFRQRCRSLVAFHMDAWYAFTKVNSFSLMHPAAWISAALLGTRCGLLAILQLLRPYHSFSSGGKN